MYVWCYTGELYRQPVKQRGDSADQGAVGRNLLMRS